MLALGIIANAEQEIIDLVEEMVVSHIRGNCLILVALPMTGARTCITLCFKLLSPVYRRH
jgi:hypothetical protein